MVISDRQLFRAVHGYRGYGDFDFDIGGLVQGISQAVTGVAGAVGQVAKAAGQGSAQPVGPYVAPYNPQAGSYPPYYPPQQPDHTLIYVVGGVAVLGVLGFLLLKK